MLGMTSLGRRTAAAIFGLVALAVVVHATALQGFWLYDDPALLVEAIQQPAIKILFDPAEYTHLATHTFTPLLLYSFKLDLLLGGLRPAVFYAHQVSALTIAALLMFFLLRRYTSDLFAFLGGAIFLTTWAAVYAARTLMIRHYVEGLVFALAALLAWRRSKWLAAFFYLLAMLSKEVYAPIPIFFICDARFEKESWRQIARDLVGPAVAAIAFLAWRWYMTGLTGTYPSTLAPPGDLAGLPTKLWIHLAGPVAQVWVGTVWAVAIVAVLAIFVWRFRGAALALIAATLLVALLPILPVTGNFEWRYSFAFVAFVVLLFALAARQWQLPAIVLVTIAVTAFFNRRYYEDLTRNGIAREGEYIWSQPAAAPVLGAASPAWYLDSLRWLRAYDHRGVAPRAVYSSYAMSVGGVRQVAFVDPAAKQIFADHPRGRFDPSLPLTVNFAIRNHNAEWQLGPPAARFVFLTDPGYAAIPIPQRGIQRVPVAREKQFFRIVRELSDGRWTVSPTLPVPEEGGHCRFRY